MKDAPSIACSSPCDLTAPNDDPGTKVLAGAALLGLALLCPGQADAQAIGPGATERGVTVLTRPRPEFDPAGVRLSSFRLDASLDAGLGYDDNLQPGTRPARSGGFAEEALSVSGVTNWTRHAIEARATQATRQHLQDSDLNWNDYAVGLLGRYDIGRASWLRLRYDHIRSHLDVDNVDVQADGSSVPVPFDTDGVQVAGLAAFNRLRLGASLDYRIIRYQNVTVNGVRDIVSNNDYQTALGEFTADYSFLPGRSVLGLVRLQDISYDRSSERGRDSFTWEAQGGVEYDFTGTWQARLLVGYRERDYEQPGLKSLSGPAFEGEVVLLPSQLTTVTLTVQRTLEESIRESSVSYTRTAARLRTDYELLRNVILAGELRGENRNYPRGGGKASDVIGLVEARVLLNRNMSMVATYQHTERLEAPAGLREYGRNQVLLRLRFSL
jgi:hypothetical protein